MKTQTSYLTKWLTDEVGATAVEYALLVATIATVIAAGVRSLGGLLLSIFTNMATKF